MRIQAELCHIEESRVVVRVSAWKNKLNLGSTLAEGPTTTVAEENGIKQILKRISLGEDLITYYLDESQTQIKNNPIQSDIINKTEETNHEKLTPIINQYHKW